MPTENETTRLPDAALQQLFTEARTHVAWQPKQVSDETLRELYGLLKFGPTSANTSPARFVFVRTPEGKQRLRRTLSEGNVEKTMAAPATVIVAYDEQFYDHVPRLFPARPQMAESFRKMPNPHDFIMRNGSLQGAYLIVAARALGLDCGPMSGFDNNKVDAEFFAGSSWKSNFLCNLGYGDPGPLHPRLPRLEFEEACRLE